MNRDDTARLLGRLKAAYGRTWNEDTLREWHGFLERYPARQCNEALDALIHAGEDGPNLPTFLRAVKERAPSAHHELPREPCDICGGSGWEQTQPVEHRGYAYTQVAPCRCSTGRRMETVHAGILTTNGEPT